MPPARQTARARPKPPVKPKPWVVTVDGQQLGEDDLTLGEAEQIVDLTGDDWRNIHPLRSPKHLRAIIAVFKARSGMPVDEAFAQGGDVKLSDALDQVGVKDEPVPLGRKRASRAT